MKRKTSHKPLPSCPYGTATPDWCRQHHKHKANERPLKTAADRDEVIRQAGDPEIYETRLGYRGGRDITQRINTSIAPGYQPPPAKMRWIKRDGKWQLMDVRNSVQQATAAVHDGTIKALTTDSIPANPSLGWWHQIDKHAEADAKRKANRDRSAWLTMVNATIISEHARGETTALPPEVPHIELPTPDVVLERQREHEAEVREAAYARGRLEELRVHAGVDEPSFALLIEHLGRQVSLRQLGKKIKPACSDTQVKRLITPALDRLLKYVPTGALTAAFRLGYGYQ